MAIHLSGGRGCAAVLVVLFVPAILAAYFFQSVVWLLITPAGIIILALLVAATFSSKRKVTPEQFADELERHLLGTGGKWDWDDSTSVAIADERLERIRWELTKFDSLNQENAKEELQAIIAALRRGELPEVVPPKHLTYRDR
jgi:hypothetical protein